MTAAIATAARLYLGCVIVNPAFLGLSAFAVTEGRFYRLEREMELGIPRDIVGPQSCDHTGRRRHTG
jgi:hypothetical protein